MFDQPRIGLDHLPHIQRDQFVYYVEVEHILSDPTDWATLRHALLRTSRPRSVSTPPSPTSTPTSPGHCRSP